tara:strand:- start:958 stop:1509 length:552 start_codon:yes stop_codon:yes gene_type:complete
MNDLILKSADVGTLDSAVIKSPLGIIAPTLAKVAVGAGAFAPLTMVANTHYLVTGTLTASNCVIPEGTAGDVIVVEMVSTTVDALMVANTAVVKFTSALKFDVNSCVRWPASPASNGGALLTFGWDADVSVAADDDLILTGATAGGPGNGTKIVFSRGESQWRADGYFYGAGAMTAVPNVAFG